MSQPTTTTSLTVVLVHGAFADSSSWAGVIERLQAGGVQVIAAANPLRGISHDSAYVASVFDQIPGPVLAVGHSYGGAVISNAATRSQNVVGLVYVAAFAPDEGEKLIEVTGSSTDSVLGSALVPRQYPTGSGPGTEFLIDPAKARDAFAADLTDEQAALIGTIQRPVADLAFGEPIGSAGMEDAALLGRRRHERPGRRNRRRPSPRPARRRRDHRGRRLTRDHDLAARGGHGGDPGRDGQAQLT